MIVNRDNFERWIAGQPLDRTFVQGSAENCPIACYLKEAQGAYGVSVGSHIAANGYSEPTPAWASTFIAKFDNGDSNNNLKALGILSTI